MTTTTDGEVLLMTYFFGTDFQGCVLYHLNGPNPVQPRLVTSIDGLFREASLAPLEDGSVLMGIRTTSQIQIGRLLADSFDYEELAIFPLPSSEEFRAFSLSQDFKASLSSLVVSDLTPVGTSESCFYSPSQDITLKIEYSSDLSIWREAINQVESDIFNISGRGSVFVTTSLESALETPRQFMRFRATRNR